MRCRKWEILLMRFAQVTHICPTPFVLSSLTERKLVSGQFLTNHHTLTKNKAKGKFKGLKKSPYKC